MSELRLFKQLIQTDYSFSDLFAKLLCVFNQLTCQPFLMICWFIQHQPNNGTIMIKNTTLWIILFLLLLPVVKAVELEYYLPESKQYSTDIPSPQSSLGYQVGEWHVRPEQIERYFYLLAEKSPRVKLEIYGYTHEKRPLFLAYISSAENIKDLESIRKQHLVMEKQTDRPAVSWMGYSVHGNEASGSNASLLFAYHLTAATDSQTLAQLDNQIIIIDPMVNPDGLARFAHWANMYKSKNPNSDPATKEHNEVWPRGRTNHYWFDLNRDWLLLQHPESQGRVKMFHHWKPNVLTDFHEMGTNSTYFFQPGVKARQNPLTPKENFELTAKIAEYHAAALDDIGSLYYSKESFDDFYFGKGSTYPDINGAIGILFEQASARGHLQESVNGEVSFPFAIKNHLTTSFSTIKAVQENKKSLLRYQRNFYQQSKLKANASRTRAVVFSSTDAYRIREFKKILTGHQIQFMPLGREININGQKFKPGSAYIIPFNQSQYFLINSIFEKRDRFEDNTFYDVSSWTMPLAFDIDYQMVSRSDYSEKLLAQERQVTTSLFETIDKETVALAFDWSNFSTANLLNYFHQNKILVRLAGKQVRVATSNGYQILEKGDLIVPVKAQNISIQALIELLQPKLAELDLEPIKVRSGLAISGPDLGSPSMPRLKSIAPLLIIGEGVSSYQAGEVWHLMDQRLEQNLSMMTISEFSKLDTVRYSHIIMVDGTYEISGDTLSKLNLWIKAGGILITQSGASTWVSEQNWLSSQGLKLEPVPDTKLGYSEMDDTESKHFIGGAITSTKIDLSHPLAFGLSDENLAIFKTGQFSFTEPKESFVSFARFSKKPLLAGYMSKENQTNLANKTAMLVQAHGKGKIIAFTDNMNFRGFWLGTSRVFVNALYFSDILKAVPKTEQETDDMNQSMIKLPKY